MLTLVVLNWTLPLAALVFYVIPFWVLGEFRWGGFHRWYAPVFVMRRRGWKWHDAAWRDFGGLGLMFAAVVRFDWHPLKNHEARHCLQWLALGMVFPVLYLGHTVWLWARGGKPYLDNWFEVDARNQEGKSFPPAGSR